MILNGARKRIAAEEAKAHEAARLTEPVRDTKQLEETGVEREMSTQSQAPYSPSEGVSSSPLKLDTVQRVMDKVPEIESRMEWGPRSEVTRQYSGYAQPDLWSMSDHIKHPQPSRELSYSQHPVFCPTCTALAHCSPQPWDLEATGANYVKTCETPEQTFADRLKNMRQQLEKLQQSKI
jgi:hypothetical protein